MVTILNPKGAKERNKCYQSPTKLGLMKERPPYSTYCHYQKYDTKLLVPLGEPRRCHLQVNPCRHREDQVGASGERAAQYFLISVNSYVKSQY